MGFVPQGKVWVRIHGLYQDDLFEVDESTPEQEIANARALYKKEYPNKCVVISVERITHEGSK